MFLGTRDGFELVVRCGRSLGFGETAIRNFSGLGDEANGRVGIRPFGGRSPLLYDATKPPGVQRRCNSAIRASGACGLKPLNGVSNRIFVKGRLGSSLSPSATLSIRSMGLGMLPIGSVGMMTDVGLATFTSFQSRCAVEEQHKRVLWPVNALRNRWETSWKRLCASCGGRSGTGGCFVATATRLPYSFW